MLVFEDLTKTTSSIAFGRYYLWDTINCTPERKPQLGLRRRRRKGRMRKGRRRNLRLIDDYRWLK